jgi:hypothetical protein
MTRAHVVQPLRRVVRDYRGREYVAEIRAETLVLRPIRARRAEAIVTTGWGAIYARAFRPPIRRRAISRGLLRTSR